ncbi:hypothetical protein [Bacillus sp. SD088]|uniref:hypothetical protein n=1 Tax=Bacillus sp. SD088 TaxID=2782012 RepID=UPI001A958C60|nr:hypothetical protein [Bacillus sp. SD088]MBO0992811.1 hypothetical protein [Bacillus sp. SD088]
MNENGVELSGKIGAVPVVDLRNMKSVDELRNITRISAVGAILLSDTFQGTLASIPMNSVGTVIRLPDEGKVNQIGGTMKLGGEFLENQGADGSDILLVTGELLITSPPKKFGYKQLIVVGQLFIPRESMSVVTPFITQSSGEIIAYDHHNPRLLMGGGQLGREFFEYMKKPITLILMGEFIIEKDVDAQLLQEKVTEIILMGVLKTVDKKLIPILTALTEEQMGTIETAVSFERNPHG